MCFGFVFLAFINQRWVTFHYRAFSYVQSINTYQYSLTVICLYAIIRSRAEMAKIHKNESGSLKNFKRNVKFTHVVMTLQLIAELFFPFLSYFDGLVSKCSQFLFAKLSLLNAGQAPDMDLISRPCLKSLNTRSNPTECILLLDSFF